MATDSSAAGYLSPVDSAPLDDDALADVLHDWLQGLSGIAGTLIRPRWQPEPPNQPDFNTDWIAFGLTRFEEDTNAYERHIPDAQGSTSVEYTEIATMLVSTYGPNARGNMRRLRMGAMLSQNRAALLAYKIAVVQTQDPVVLPALLKEKWVQRIDSAFTLRRYVTRTYAVLNVLTADIELDNEYYVTNISTAP